MRKGPAVFAEGEVLVPPTQPESQIEDALYRKITKRILPFLFLCYLLAYVDRVNVGFAKLQMQSDLKLSDTAYGLGAGIFFFIGYFLFEIPANMMLRKLGARRWIGPIMIVWGIVSAGTLLTRGPHSYYAARFLLGIVESGFFPGVILYLTFWYTRKHRAKIVSAFMTAIPISSVLASPISGWILKRMTAMGGLAPWQWLFLIEGIPPILVGVVTLFYLPDGPAKAKWLAPEERELVLRRLDQEEEIKRSAGAGEYRVLEIFRIPQVWLMCLIYFGINSGSYGLSLWLPQLIKETITPDPQAIGWIVAIPWGAGAVAMYLSGRHSDRTGERRWHIAAPLLIGAAAFSFSAIPGLSGVVGLAALTFAACGILCANSVFWTLPSALLSGAAAAAGIAFINSVGNLGGGAGPYLVGYIRDHTHSMFAALLLLSFFALVSGLVALWVARAKAVAKAG